MKKIVFALAVLFLFAGCDKKKFDVADLYGKWQSGTLYEKYNASGNGSTWDEGDDVTEEEAQTFTWELDKETLTRYHQMEGSSAVVPKTFTIKTLTATTLVYETSGGKTFTFTKQ